MGRIAFLFGLLKLVTLLRLAMKLTLRFIQFAIFNSYFPTVPSPVWDTTIRSRTPPDTATRIGHICCPEVEKYANTSTLLSLAPFEKIIPDSVPTALEMRTAVGQPPLIKIEEHRIENDNMTTIETSSSYEIGFSIYADVSSPNLNKAMFITPPQSRLLSAQEYQFSLLKAASERVSEILRENRRRLDAGEDSNIIRREARRRRAQELATSRSKSARLV